MALKNVKSVKVLTTMVRISTICEILGLKSYAASLGMLELLCSYFDEPISQMFKRRVSKKHRFYIYLLAYSKIYALISLVFLSNFPQIMQKLT